MLRIIFAGTPAFAATLLQALIDGPHDVVAVFTQPDKAAGRGQHLHMSEVKQLALAHNLPVYQPPTLRDTQTQNTLASLHADVMVVAAYSHLLPQAILDIPRLGCINVHASLLPRWRGAAPIARAIANGDHSTGITFMQMDAGLDTGPILHAFSLPICDTDTHANLTARLASLGASHLNAALDAIAAKKIRPVAQDPTLATFAEKLTKSEGLIPWNKDAAYLSRLVRALNPWPMAFSFLQQQRVQIWQAQPLETQANLAPGTIMALSEAGIDVSTAQGVLRLIAIQIAGKRKMLACECYKTKHPLFKVGNVFN